MNVSETQSYLKRFSIFILQMLAMLSMLQYSSDMLANTEQQSNTGIFCTFINEVSVIAFEEKRNGHIQDESLAAVQAMLGKHSDLRQLYAEQQAAYQNIIENVFNLVWKIDVKNRKDLESLASEICLITAIEAERRDNSITEICKDLGQLYEIFTMLKAQGHPKRVSIGYVNEMLETEYIATGNLDVAAAAILDTVVNDVYTNDFLGSPKQVGNLKYQQCLSSHTR